MKKADKNALAILAAVIVGLIVLYLLLRGRGSTVYQTGTPGDMIVGGVEMPGLDFAPRSPFLIPGPGAPYQRLSAIGACCSDCSGARPIASRLAAPSSPSLTISFEQAPRAANVYNYITMPAPAIDYGGSWGIGGAA